MVFGSLTQLFTYEDERDAEDALHYLDRYKFLGRELEVEFARGDRKSKSSTHQSTDIVCLLILFNIVLTTFYSPLPDE